MLSMVVCVLFDCPACVLDTVFRISFGPVEAYARFHCIYLVS